MRGSGVIACVFDFDETIAPDSTTKFLDSKGVDTLAFWQQARDLSADGWDPTLAWLKLFLDSCGEGKPLGRITNAELRAFGETLAEDVYPRFGELMADLRKTVGTYRDMTIEFYVVSGGLRAMIEGCRPIADAFTGVYGCELEEIDGCVRQVKRCVTFTEKTRYLFEINKGIPQAESAISPYLVNRAVEPDDRRVPFTNMVYVGDGLTDIPCFSLLQKSGGVAFGVFEASNEGKAKRALTDFLQQRRVLGMYAPRYGPDDDLGALLRATVANMCTRIEINSRQAYGG